MNIITRSIRWITPTGWTLRQLRNYRNEVRASGVLTIGKCEIQIHELKPTCYNGVFLAYSVDEYNKEINYAINDLKFQIEQLVSKLR